MGSSLTWKAAASRRVPRPKARRADSRRAGCVGRAAACRNDLVSIVSASKSKNLKELDAVQGSVRFAEKAKSDAVRCLRDRHQTSGSSEVCHMPRCAMSCPMYRKLLDQAVEFR
jgi:hypothetical protein